MLGVCAGVICSLGSSFSVNWSGTLNWFSLLSLIDSLRFGATGTGDVESGTWVDWLPLTAPVWPENLGLAAIVGLLLMGVVALLVRTATIALLIGDAGCFAQVSPLEVRDGLSSTTSTWLSGCSAVAENVQELLTVVMGELLKFRNLLLFVMLPSGVFECAFEEVLPERGVAEVMLLAILRYTPVWLGVLGRELPPRAVRVFSEFRICTILRQAAEETVGRRGISVFNYSRSERQGRQAYPHWRPHRRENRWWHRSRSTCNASFPLTAYELDLPRSPGGLSRWLSLLVHAYRYVIREEIISAVIKGAYLGCQWERWECRCCSESGSFGCSRRR